LVCFCTNLEEQKKNSEGGILSLPATKIFFVGHCAGLA
jgi:hypothetical protein